MQLAEACNIIGVRDNATPDEILEAYTRLKVSYELAVYRSSDAETRSRNLEALHQLEAARVVAIPDYQPTPSPFGTGASITPPPGDVITPFAQQGLTATQYMDLPTPSAHLTGINDYHAGQPIPSLSPGGIQSGSVLAGRYEIIKLIGAGGMGQVFEAYDKVSQRNVAIKLLLPVYSKSQTARERFMNEARLSISLSHPNIANVHDVQQDGDLCFLSMELLSGRTLRQEMQAKADARAIYTPEDVVAIAGPVCEALSYAHRFTVHRDIKPENIWMGKDGSVKIMDFGIAQVLTPTRMTQTAMAVGTVLYMSPEQMQNAKDVDGRADQYSLAVVLYELLTGKLPTGRAKPVVEIRNDVPVTLSQAIDKALQTQPADRYPDMDALRMALLRRGLSPVAKRKRWIAAAAVLMLLVVGTFIFSNQARHKVVKQMVKPSAPTLLNAKAVDKTAVFLQWEVTTPELTDEVMVDRLDVQANKTYSFPVKGATETTDSVGLEPGTAYSYSVRAKGSAGESAPSVALPVNTLPNAPSAINGLAAAKGPNGAQEISLLWNAGTDPGVQYRLERRREGENEWKTVGEADERVMSSGQFTDRDLDPDTLYEYRIVSINQGGEKIGNLASLHTAPLKPQGLKSEFKDNKIVLTWTNEIKAGRHLVIKPDGGDEIALTDAEANKKSWAMANALHGKAYKFEALVRNSGNPKKVALSDVVNAEITVPPAPATNLKVVKSGPDSVHLKWSKSESELLNDYLVMRKEPGAEFAALPEKPSASMNEFTDEDVEAGKEYTYMVIARNKGGDSPPSNETGSVKTIPPEPQKPTSIAVEQVDPKKAEVAVRFNVNQQDVPYLKRIVLKRAERQDGPYTEIATDLKPASEMFYVDRDVQDGGTYFYQAVLEPMYYPPVVQLFPKPVIPKMQRIVEAAPGGGAPGAAGAAPTPKPTPLIHYGAVPTPAIMREANVDKELKGLSTPTPSPYGK